MNDPIHYFVMFKIRVRGLGFGVSGMGWGLG